MNTMYTTIVACLKNLNSLYSGADTNLPVRTVRCLHLHGTDSRRKFGFYLKSPAIGLLDCIMFWMNSLLFCLLKYLDSATW